MVRGLGWSFPSTGWCHVMMRIFSIMCIMPSITNPLVINVDSTTGNPVQWPLEVIRHSPIAYCVEEFDAAGEGVDDNIYSHFSLALRMATHMWSSSCGVQFIPRGSCKNLPQALIKVVVQDVGDDAVATSTVARALEMCGDKLKVERGYRGASTVSWPSGACAEQSMIFVDWKIVTSNYMTLVSVLAHEIGHSLGFAHEHITNPNVGPSCLGISKTPIERVDNGTKFDPRSIMSYAGDCGGVPNVVKIPSMRDREGASNVYGPSSKDEMPKLREESFTLTRTRKGEGNGHVTIETETNLGVPFLSSMSVMVRTRSASDGERAGDKNDGDKNEGDDSGGRGHGGNHARKHAGTLVRKTRQLQQQEVRCNIAEMGTRAFCELFNQRPLRVVELRRGSCVGNTDGFSPLIWRKGRALENMHRILGSVGVGEWVDAYCCKDDGCGCGIVKVDVQGAGVRRKMMQTKGLEMEKITKDLSLFFPQCKQTAHGSPPTSREVINMFSIAGNDARERLESKITVTISDWPGRKTKALVLYNSLEGRRGDSSNAAAPDSDSDSNVGSGDGGGVHYPSHVVGFGGDTNADQHNLKNREISTVTLSGLDLSDDTAQYLLEEGHDYNCIQAQFNELKVIPPNAIHAELEELNLCNNVIFSVPPTTLRSLLTETRLTRLSLCHNLMASFGGDDDDWVGESGPSRDGALVPALGRLEELDLSYNFIRSIPSIVTKLTNLKVLNLAGNWLSSLPAEVDGFASHGTLTTLYLSSNRLTSMPPFTFPRLVSLSLAGNDLGHLTRDLPSLFPSLQHLDLSGNDKISRNSTVSSASTTLHCPSSLQTIAWRESKLAHLSLRGCENVTLLDLSSNQLATLSRDPPLSNLRKLFLNRNLFTNMTLLGINSSESSNSEFRSLELLELSRNMLQGQIDVTVALPSVKRLNLSHNKMSHLSIPSKLAPKLKWLDVRNNQLRSLDSVLHGDSSASSSLSNIENLYAQHNRLLTVPAAIWRKQNSDTVSADGVTVDGDSSEPFRRELDLSHNQLTSQSLRLPNCFMVSREVAGGDVAPLVKDEMMINQKIINWRKLLGNRKYMERYVDVVRDDKLGEKEAAAGVDIVGSKIANKSKVQTALEFPLVNLAHNKLKSLPKDLLCIGRVGKLNLQSNLVGQLPFETKPATGVELSIRQLDLSHNKLGPALWWPLAGEIDGLESLDYSHNAIGKLLSHESKPWLKRLDVSNNKLSSLDLEVLLIGSPHLYHVDASWNRLNNLRTTGQWWTCRESRSGCYGKTQLSFATGEALSSPNAGKFFKNDLQSAEDAQVGQSHLFHRQYINLQGNNITSEAIRWMIDVDDNLLENKRERFVSQVSRAQINLCWNPAKVLSTWDCRDASNWLHFAAVGLEPTSEHVDVSRSLMSSIDLNLLHGVRAIDVSLNRLTVLRKPISSFIGQTWEEIDASGNYLKSIPDFLVDLPKLKSLLLSENKLEVIPKGVFEHPTLEVLDISFNPLTRLPALSKPSNLREILLNDCSERSKFPEPFLSQMPLLEYVDVTRTPYTFLELSRMLTANVAVSKRVIIAGLSVTYSDSDGLVPMSEEELNNRTQWVVYPSVHQYSDYQVLTSTNALTSEFTHEAIPRHYVPLNPKKTVRRGRRDLNLGPRSLPPKVLYMRRGDGSLMPFLGLRSFWFGALALDVNNRAYEIYLPRGSGSGSGSDERSSFGDTQYSPVATAFVSCVPVRVSRSGRTTRVNVTATIHPHSSLGGACMSKWNIQPHCPWHDRMVLTQEISKSRNPAWLGILQVARLAKNDAESGDVDGGRAEAARDESLGLGVGLGGLSQSKFVFKPEPFNFSRPVDRSDRWNKFYLSQLTCQTPQVMERLSKTLQAMREFVPPEHDFLNRPATLSLQQQRWLTEDTLSHVDVNFNDLLTIEIWTSPMKVIPREIVALHKLKVLDLRVLPITELPEDMSNMKALEYVRISSCRLSNADVLFKLPNVKHIDVSFNLIPKLSDVVTGAKGLKRLFVKNNQLSSLPQWVRTHPTLEELQCGHNNIRQMGDWSSPSLRELYIDHNAIPSLPDNLGQGLPDLKKFVASSNNLATLPVSVFSHSRLHSLIIQNNEITKLPDVALGHNVHDIGLSQNRFKRFPTSILNSTKLEWINFSHNTIEHPLPTQLLQTSSLRGIRMWNCSLTDDMLEKLEDPLPDSKLQLLTLGMNQLTKVPSAVMKLPRLQILKVTYNNMTTLPREMMQLSQLNNLQAHPNPFDRSDPSFVDVFGWISDNKIHTNINGVAGMY